MNGSSSVKSGMLTGFTAFAFEIRAGFEGVGKFFKVARFFSRNFLTAFRANNTYKSLADNAKDARRYKIGFYAHVKEPGQSARSVVCVQGGKNQMAGQGSAYGDFRGFKVTYFAHHHNIRVMPQKVPQPLRKGQSDFRMNLHLDNALQLIFDGVFQGDYFSFLVIQFVQTGVKGGGFSASRRAGQKYDAIRRLEQ